VSQHSWNAQNSDVMIGGLTQFVNTPTRQQAYTSLSGQAAAVVYPGQLHVQY